MSPKEQAECNHLAAMAIYCDGRVLNLFDGRYLQALLQRLNPAWKIPGATIFAASLLDKEYEAMKKLHYLLVVTSTLLQMAHRILIITASTTYLHLLRLEPYS